MNNKDINPMVLEDTSIVSKIKTKFGKRKEEQTKEVNEFEELGHIHIDFLGMNNAIPICAEACACCWDKKVPDGYQEIAEYIAKRSRIGHTSVIEHSNFVILISTPKKFVGELVNLLDSCNYLNHRTITSTDGSIYYTILGGSFRGYSDIYREIDNLNNPILQAITQTLYTYSHSAMFEDLGKLGLMDMRGFMNTEPDENYLLLTDTEAMNSESETDLFKIIGIDSIKKLFNNLYKANEYVANSIGIYDLIKFTTVTVLFKNMSRTCTHQLVRHRNAITQESQRYVDYSSACFSSPVTFKPDKYDPDHKYTIIFGSGPNQKMTLDELGDELCKIYGQLTNPGKGFELLKEDARAYLPGNVQCRKIYITFTYKNLLKFLNLREHSAAQAEIRMYATALGDYIRANTDINTKEICDNLTNPRLLVEEPFKIDVEGDIEEEVREITEDDYITAAGLDNAEEDDNTAVLTLTDKINIEDKIV